MKKFLAIFLTTLLLVIPMVTIVASATSYNQESNEKKITNELKAEMENKKNNEYISIYIWLYDLGDDVVYSRLSNKLGKKISKDNEEIYIDEKVKNKVEKYKEKQKTKNGKNEKFDVAVFREEAEISEILTNEEIEKCIDSGKTTEQVIELSEQYQYLSDFRDSRAYVNASINELFESSIKKSKCKNVNVDMLLPYVTMDCKKSYISKLSTMNIVKEIGIVTSESLIVEESETVEATTTDKYIMSPPNVNNNLGGGIKIGVIETNNYNPNATHLVGANITKYTSGTVSYLNHATVVLSILCGKAVTKNGIEYGGVAPASTIFFAKSSDPFSDSSEFFWLIVEKDVAVINLSVGGTSNNPGNYSKEEDNYLDCLILQYRVAVVKSAGNESSISSPGMAYNAITVGNLSNETDSNGDYKINEVSSSFEEADYLTNKPDICAFGTDVHMLYNNEETNFGQGTSWAAPQVTGTIALMMAENNKLIGKPDAVKAILVNTAEEEKVSLSENGRVSTHIKESNITITKQITEKGGAGLLNIEGAVSMAKANLIHRYAIPRTSTTANATKTTGEYYFEAGQKIEISLVFEKPFDNEISSLNDVNFDFDIEIYKGDTSLMSSTSSVNNVESYTVKFNESGYYYFKIRCDKLNAASEQVFKDSENNILEHNTHNYFYVSFVLSCDCALPSLQIVENSETQSGHYLTCNNCDTTFLEKHDYKSITQHFNGVDVTYGVYYKVHPLWVDENYPAFFCINRENLTPMVEATDSGNLATAILNSSNIEYQNEKYWEFLSYEIIVFTPTYDVVASYISTLYVNIYYTTGECDFDTSV